MGENVMKVGEPYQRIVGKPECCFVDHTDVWEFIVNYSKPKQSEIDSYKEGKTFEIRFCVVSGIMFFLFKAEGQPWQDAPFDPHLAANNEYEEIVSDRLGYAAMIMVADSPSGIVKNIRVIGLGSEFSKKMRKNRYGTNGKAV